MNWLTFFIPWDTLWWLIALFVAVAGLYVRGLFRIKQAVNPWAAAAFFVGLIGMYLVMESRFDYYGHSIFFMHRLQHLVLHHLGPFLIAVSAPSAILVAGSPRWLRAIGRAVARNPLFRLTYRTVQQPIIAGVIFAGLIVFWLWPAVHFNAMLSFEQYWIMNLSMAADGMLFWWLMMDPRPPGSTPTTRGIGIRMAVLWGVMIPQIIVGAILALRRTPIYDVYAVCGRVWPISPLRDQHIGGLITWIPAAMMSAVATLFLLHYMFRHIREKERARSPEDSP